jgi:hypothetical protein
MKRQVKTKKLVKRKSQKRLKRKVNFKKKLHKKIKYILVKQLLWPKSIANFAAWITCALLSATGVWHKKIAQSIEGDVLVESTERRIQRFFGKFIINYHFFSVMLYSLLGIKGKLAIILDRTNWDYGKKHINIFVAAALYKRIGLLQNFAVPLAWEVFDKKGNSNTQERKKLMTRIFCVVGKENIEVVLADREFIGDEWLNFLHVNGIPFIVRIKKMMFVEYGGKRVNALGLVSSVKYNKKLQFDVLLNGIPIKLAATRSVDGELVIVAASMDVVGDPLDQYRLRWMIELFFKSAKTKGFNIEETHMTDPAKIKSIFAFVALASVCAVIAGDMRQQFKKIPIKNHGRPKFSLFTYGLDFFRAIFRGVAPSRMLGAAKNIFLPDDFEAPTFRVVEEEMGFDEKRVFTLVEG